MKPPIQFQENDNERSRLEKLKRLAAQVAAFEPTPQPTGVHGSVWRSGSGPPAATLGDVGDFYLDADTGDYYERVS